MSDAPAAPEPTPAPAAGAPVPAPAGVDYPGKTLGIVGLVLAILGFFSGGFMAIIGLILGAVAKGQSKAAGYTNTPAKIAVILGVIALVIGVIIVIIIVTVLGSVVAQCAELGPGVHTVNGGTITCG